jgi:hypothetical protein
VVSCVRLAVSHGTGGRDMIHAIIDGIVMQVEIRCTRCNTTWELDNVTDCYASAHGAKPHLHGACPKCSFGGCLHLDPKADMAKAKDPRAPDFRSPGILWCIKHERHYHEKNGCGGCR